MRDFHVPSSNCPNCGVKQDGALAVTSIHRPEPGDIMVCIDCSHICIYSDNLTLRDPTDEEMVEIAGNPTIIKMMRTINEANKRRKQ